MGGDYRVSPSIKLASNWSNRNIYENNDYKTFLPDIMSDFVKVLKFLIVFILSYLHAVTCKCKCTLFYDNITD